MIRTKITFQLCLISHRPPAIAAYEAGASVDELAMFVWDALDLDEPFEYLNSRCLLRPFDRSWR